MSAPFMPPTHRRSPAGAYPPMRPQPVMPMPLPVPTGRRRGHHGPRRSPNNMAYASGGYGGYPAYPPQQRPQQQPAFYPPMPPNAAAYPYPSGGMMQPGYPMQGMPPPGVPYQGGVPFQGGMPFDRPRRRGY